MPSKTGVAVIGAGVFGCWSALSLQEAGCPTTLVDAWGVAHPRASSAGETRLIRMGYGPKAHYTEWAWESLDRWKRAQESWDCHLFVPGGVVWVAPPSDPDLRLSIKALTELNIPHQLIPPRELAQRYPQFNAEDLGPALLEPESGVLFARKACRRAARAFQRQGGEFLLGRVLPPHRREGEIVSLALADGRQIKADRFLFCCGPWLPQLFPDWLAEALKPTRQEVFFFGPPAGSEDYDIARMPAWIELGEQKSYGVPACAGRGFKVARDERGPECDPSSQERTPSPKELKKVRSYMEHRFPGLKGAPLVESRVCQYEASFDQDLLMGVHPRHPNLFVAGGGSGHGFKLGPAVGKRAADMVLGRSSVPPQVSLKRLK